MIVLGIETSCDETAVAILHNRQILSHVLLSQIDLHAKWGGVIPEIASRNHLDVIDLLIQQAIEASNVKLADIDAFAATTGPGLIGGLLVGAFAAKTLASIYKKPFLSVNHLHAHAMIPLLYNEKIQFPFLLLLISGGHTQFIIAQSFKKYKIIGTSLDDSIGEAFDKCGKMLGFPYPAGPLIEKHAKLGNPIYTFPLPCYKTKGCNLSFSGLKTAVNNFINKHKKIADNNCLSQQMINDVCASLQVSIANILIDRLNNATQEFIQQYAHNQQLVISGGVAANQYLREHINQTYDHWNIDYPPLELCTDNAIMIAWTGINKLLNGDLNDQFDISSRWSLENI